MIYLCSMYLQRNRKVTDFPKLTSLSCTDWRALILIDASTSAEARLRLVNITEGGGMRFFSYWSLFIQIFLILLVIFALILWRGGKKSCSKCTFALWFLQVVKMNGGREKWMHLKVRLTKRVPNEWNEEYNNVSHNENPFILLGV